MITVTYPYEVPLVIQDRQFFATGELYYPSDPSLYPFDPGTGPTIPLPPVTHLPEFFGDIMLVMRFLQAVHLRLRALRFGFTLQPVDLAEQRAAAKLQPGWPALPTQSFPEMRCRWTRAV